VVDTICQLSANFREDSVVAELEMELGEFSHQSAAYICVPLAHVDCA